MTFKYFYILAEHDEEEKQLKKIRPSFKMKTFRRLTHKFTTCFDDGRKTRKVQTY